MTVRLFLPLPNVSWLLTQIEPPVFHPTSSTHSPQPEMHTDKQPTENLESFNAKIVQLLTNKTVFLQRPQSDTECFLPKGEVQELLSQLLTYTSQLEREVASQSQTDASWKQKYLGLKAFVNRAAIEALQSLDEAPGSTATTPEKIAPFSETAKKMCATSSSMQSASSNHCVNYDFIPQLGYVADVFLNNQTNGGVIHIGRADHGDQISVVVRPAG